MDAACCFAKLLRKAAGEMRPYDIVQMSRLLAQIDQVCEEHAPVAKIMKTWYDAYEFIFELLCEIPSDVGEVREAYAALRMVILDQLRRAKAPFKVMRTAQGDEVLLVLHERALTLVPFPMKETVSDAAKWSEWRASGKYSQYLHDGVLSTIQDSLRQSGFVREATREGEVPIGIHDMVIEKTIMFH